MLARLKRSIISLFDHGEPTWRRKEEKTHWQAIIGLQQRGSNLQIEASDGFKVWYEIQRSQLKRLSSLGTRRLLPCRAQQPAARSFAASIRAESEDEGLRRVNSRRLMLASLACRTRDD